MLIGVKKRFVFVANTKTASNSIEEALVLDAEIKRGGSARRKHISMRDALVEYDFLFGQPDHAPASFFRFGVMREPLEWIGSWYRYRRSAQIDSALPESLDFEGFWKLNDWNRWVDHGVRRLQRDFFTDRDGKLIVDYLIPFDDLEAHFGKICAALGIGRELKKLNVSRLRPTDLGLSAELETKVRNFYSRDYAMFRRLEAINARGLRKLKAMAAERGRANSGEP